MNAREAAEKIWGKSWTHDELEQIIQAAITEATRDLQAEVARLREELNKYKQALTDSTERAMRAELLVRLMITDCLTIDARGELLHVAVCGRTEDEDIDLLTAKDTNGIPQLTDEQWERLAELEGGE